MTSVSIVGASGFIGGELIRLLLGHPDVTLAQVSSNSRASHSVASVHPNLRGQTSLQFVRHDEIEHCDVLMFAMPHGTLHRKVADYRALAALLIDLSADFRIKDVSVFERYYGEAHQAKQFLPDFVSGIPEFLEADLAKADLIANPGCMANASILALAPLAQDGLIQENVFIDGKSGSSGAGIKPTRRTHHPSRSGAVRVAKPSGHRHEAEIRQHCGIDARLTTCSTDAVRGVLVTAFCTLADGVDGTEIRDTYRRRYQGSRFVRLMTGRKGLSSLPEPKILSGTNFCDIGFSLGPRDGDLVVFSALDNLVKGGAGNAIQCMNINLGFEKDAGLGFSGLHPI